MTVLDADFVRMHAVRFPTPLGGTPSPARPDSDRAVHQRFWPLAGSLTLVTPVACRCRAGPIGSAARPLRRGPLIRSASLPARRAGSTLQGRTPGACAAGSGGGQRRRLDQVRLNSAVRLPAWATGLGGVHPERVTGIEPALSAWDYTDCVRNMHREQHFRGSANDRETPLITGVNGPAPSPLRAWRHRRQALSGEAFLSLSQRCSALGACQPTSTGNWGAGMIRSG